MSRNDIAHICMFYVEVLRVGRVEVKERRGNGERRSDGGEGENGERRRGEEVKEVGGEERIGIK